MTIDDATRYAAGEAAQDQIFKDPDFLRAVRRGAAWTAAASKPAPERRGLGIGDLFHAAIGAAAGSGIARGIGSVLGLSPRFTDKLESAAMGLGAVMNTGILKSASIEEERTRAFKLGFAKAAVETKILEKTAGLLPIPVISLSPSDLLAIPRGAAQAASTLVRGAGTALGTADAVDEDEEEITRSQVEKSLLQERLDRVRAEKRNAALRNVLAKRRV